MKRQYKASFTVEASVVFSVALLFISAFFESAMKLHDICYGNAVIAEALEKVSQSDDENMDYEIRNISEQMAKKKSIFLSQKLDLKLRKENDSIIGYIEGREYKNIHKRKLYEPEKTLRKLTLIENIKWIE